MIRYFGAMKPSPSLVALTSFLVAFGPVLETWPVGRFAQAQEKQNDGDKFTKEQLEQLAAPIALYPDALMSQIFMASTYPLEIVQAARWQKANAKVTGKALEEAMQKQPWDESVKSLTAFPSVLQMMNDKLEWTQQLGDAFLAQQSDLLDAVQRLRQLADSKGNLKTTKEQKVTKTTSNAQTYIVIEPQDPSVVYVPYYNPTVVYGAWPYPAYPPYYWYPPGYVAGGAFWFATGVAVGAALWGGCNWGRNEVNINVNKYNQFNRANISNTNWQHNVDHRKGVPYRDNDVASRYRGEAKNAATREQYRGKVDAGRAELAKPETRQAARDAVQKQPGQLQKQPGQLQKQPGQTKAPTTGPKGGDRPQTGAKQAKPADRPSQASRPKPTQKPAAFDGAGSGGKARAESARGHASRAASPAPRPSAARGGGGGGGGGRGGGGGGGGRGGGGRR